MRWALIVAAAVVCFGTAFIVRSRRAGVILGTAFGGGAVLAFLLLPMGTTRWVGAFLLGMLGSIVQYLLSPGRQVPPAGPSPDPKPPGWSPTAGDRNDSGGEGDGGA